MVQNHAQGCNYYSLPPCHLATLPLRNPAEKTMITKKKAIKSPTGWQRVLWRLPIKLYRYNLGWLLGKRFVLLNHIGRKSGLPRQAVLEVVDRDNPPGTLTIAAGFGKKAHWYQNLRANPDVTIQLGRCKMAVRAEVLSAEKSGAALLDYSRRHPKAIRRLASVIGYEMDGTDEDFLELGRKYIHFVILHPKE